MERVGQGAVEPKLIVTWLTFCQALQNNFSFVIVSLEVGCDDMSHFTSFTLPHLRLKVFEDTLDENPSQMKDDSGCKRQKDLPVVDTITDQVDGEE